MFEFQNHMMFPTHAVASPGPLPSGATRHSIPASGGDTLHGVHIAPSSPPGPGKRVLILGFGGNAWNAEDAASYLHKVYPSADIIAFHYRGYRPSTGTPSAEALIEDAPLVFDFAVSTVHPDQTIAVGFSIGSGVAASLASQRPVDGLILVTPFDSLKAVASDLYPLLPVAAFFHDDMAAATALKHSKVPTAIIAAAHDEIVPRRRTDGLRASVGKLVFDQTIARAGHNDIYARSAFQQAMDDALGAVSKG
ncbi:alpha/beta fold hydrolase [Sphingomonas sp.]|uniref:alpha/beta hydrolase n=1 Tax=Sphingomonas sp. TaxID=28214 RepID=UPI00286B73A5|nr:alpha/beta fold hydrolase [Sphingomonas sp.]